MNSPLVSVITPAYNAEEFISDAIESIIGQTFTDFEYIIIDDQSTDQTWDIIQRFSKKDQRIIALQNPKNLGIAGNRNRGKKLSHGKYIAWQDADDISLPQRLEKQCEFLEKNPKVGMVGGFLQFFDEKGNNGIRTYPANDATLRKVIFKFSPIAQPAAMIPKNVLNETGDYDLKYPPAEDLDMTFRIGSKYELANLQEVVIRYREHRNSATYKKIRKIELDTIEIRKKYAKGYGYHMTLIDKIYNISQYISIFIIPTYLKIYFFNWIRNKR